MISWVLSSITQIRYAVALLDNNAEFTKDEQHSPISSGSALLCLNSSYSVSDGNLRSSLGVLGE